jgi:hypothetical protein
LTSSQLLELMESIIMKLLITEVNWARQEICCSYQAPDSLPNWQKLILGPYPEPVESDPFFVLHLSLFHICCNKLWLNLEENINNFLSAPLVIRNKSDTSGAVMLCLNSINP